MTGSMFDVPSVSALVNPSLSPKQVSLKRVNFAELAIDNLTAVESVAVDTDSTLPYASCAAYSDNVEGPSETGLGPAELGGGSGYLRHVSS